LARLTLAGAKPGQQKAHREQIEELSRKEQDLARRLRKLGSRIAAPG